MVAVVMVALVVGPPAALLLLLLLVVWVAGVVSHKFIDVYCLFNNLLNRSNLSESILIDW